MDGYDCGKHRSSVLCTRYSELLRCTTNGVDQVIYERQHPETRAQTESMDFGIVRHKMFAQQAEETRKPYSGFNLDWPVSHVEHELVTELIPGVFVHSRLDLVCAEMGILPDYKTVLDGKQGMAKIIDSYRHESKQRQLKFYAFQLGLHGIRIKEGAYLCESWDKERDIILGYEVVRFPITMFDIAGVLPWVRQRVALLASVLEAA